MLKLLHYDTIELCPLEMYVNMLFKLCQMRHLSKMASKEGFLYPCIIYNAILTKYLLGIKFENAFTMENFWIHLWVALAHDIWNTLAA